jgi:hypothetical protein
MCTSLFEPSAPLTCRFNYTAFKDLFLKGWYEQIDSLAGPIQLPNHAFVF